MIYMSSLSSDRADKKDDGELWEHRQIDIAYRGGHSSAVCYIYFTTVLLFMHHCGAPATIVMWPMG
jgi:hypothetical protein